MVEQMPQETYREFAPPPRLRDQIICFWHRAASDDDRATRILPDGCIDLIWASDRPPLVAGPMTVPMTPAVAQGQEIIGVRFRPGAAPTLLGVSAAELLNQHVPLRAIWTGPRHQVLADAADHDELAERVQGIARDIAARLADAVGSDRFVAHGTRWLATHPSGSIDELTRLGGLSERQVRRRFEEAIGYGPKKLQRILRLQRLLWLASRARGARPSLSQLAFAAGYADQSHMTREVLALTGSPPGKLLLRSSPRSAVSDLFKTPLR